MKRILAALVIAVCAFTVVGCGGGSGTTTKTEKKP